ncbi:MAG: ATP-binding protein [Solirubrobacterales bacterium]
MIFALTVAWAIGSIAVVAVVLAARRRRSELARELHELRGALTGARLAVDLMPVLGLHREAVCQAASEELERSYHSLGEFEDLLHARLVAVGAADRRDGLGGGLIGRRSRFDVLPELERLELLWTETTRREGRRFELDWRGPVEGVVAGGPKRRFTEVMTNLLANALAHGEGDIRVLARMRSDSLRIEVHDEGPGLRLPISAMARRRRGGRHGHGLRIAMRAAKRLGGGITSAPASSGAVIVFTFPALHDPTIAARERGQAVDERRRPQLRPVGTGE